MDAFNDQELDNLKTIFETFDRDNSGSIPKTDVLSLLQELPQTQSFDIEAIQILLEDFPSDQPDLFTFSEFSQLIGKLEQSEMVQFSANASPEKEVTGTEKLLDVLR